MSQDEATRLHHAVARAQERFWQSMVESYPEVRTGDFPPDAALAFDAACTAAASVWVKGNSPVDATALVTFEFNGMQILNPLQSECGRFPVDPSVYGFETYHAGGRCMALRKDLPGDRYILITDGSSAIPDKGTPPEKVLIGLYDAEGNELALNTLADVKGDRRLSATPKRVLPAFGRHLSKASTGKG